MNAPSQPDYLRPALIGGTVAGVLSGLPFISAGNCLCCLWIIGGALLATNLLARSGGGLLRPGDGAVVGALTGVVAAVVDFVLSIPLWRFNAEMSRRALDWLSGRGYEVPSAWNDLIQSSSALASGWWVVGLLLSAVVFAAAGLVGGLIGVSIFAKRPAAPLPPGPPPPGEGHAA